MFLMVHNIALHFRLLSAYMWRPEILETLYSLMLRWNVATSLTLEAYQRPMPSVAVLIYSTEVYLD